MTCIPMPRSSFMILPDRAVGADSPDVGRRWEDYRAGDHSITRGVRYRELFESIENVAREAGAPDWDGEGARPVEPTTVEYARLFAAALPTDLPTPAISPDNDGDISFDWVAAPRRVFTVSVRRDGVINFAGLFEASKVHGSDILFDGVPSQVIQYIRQVAK